AALLRSWTMIPLMNVAGSMDRFMSQADDGCFRTRWRRCSGATRGGLLTDMSHVMDPKPVPTSGRHALGCGRNREGAMDYGIKGREAIVCASSRGLGRGCAVALAEAGCNLV